MNQILNSTVTPKTEIRTLMLSLSLEPLAHLELPFIEAPAKRVSIFSMKGRLWATIARKTEAKLKSEKCET